MAHQVKQWITKLTGWIAAQNNLNHIPDACFWMLVWSWTAFLHPWIPALMATQKAITRELTQRHYELKGDGPWTVEAFIESHKFWKWSRDHHEGWVYPTVFSNAVIGIVQTYFIIVGG